MSSFLKRTVNWCKPLPSLKCPLALWDGTKHPALGTDATVLSPTCYIDGNLVKGAVQGSASHHEDASVASMGMDPIS